MKTEKRQLIGSDKPPVFFVKAGLIIEGRLLKMKRGRKILIEYFDCGKRRLITKRLNSLKGMTNDELERILQQRQE
jgi:hypothetical protein